MGTVALHVDATDVLRRIYTIHETIPVGHAGSLTLLFPQWTPGDHAPNEPLEKLAGMIMMAQGERLLWMRDTVDVHAFHVSVPKGMIWLEADAMIRQQSEGKRSLDDFVRSFFSANDAGNVTVTYTRDDTVTALNQVPACLGRPAAKARRRGYS